MSLPAVKNNSSLATLAQSIGSLNIFEPPELPTDQSWLPRKFTKSKIRDIKEMSGYVAEIYENNTRALNAKLDGAMALMTASDRLKLEYKKIENEGKLSDIQVIREQAAARKEIALADEAEYNTKITKLDYNARLKAAREEGYDFPDEDRA